jgi:hypothetical protein
MGQAKVTDAVDFRILLERLLNAQHAVSVSLCTPHVGPGPDQCAESRDQLRDAWMALQAWLKDHTAEVIRQVREEGRCA